MKINEIFYSLQGEGPFVGQPAIFIRTAGCVKPLCDFCDSKYSWDKGKEMSVKSIINEVNGYPETNLVVITGGEPFIQKDIYKLIDELRYKHHIQVETSGKVDFKDDIPAYVVCSPKQFKGKFAYKVTEPKDLWSRALKVSCYKFVIHNESTLKSVLSFIKQKKIPKRKVYLMPLSVYDTAVDLETKKYVWKACTEHGFNYSGRLHVDVWGQKRKV